MFVVLLRFSENRNVVDQHMSGYQEWIRRGLDDGVFLPVGSIQPGLGGVVLAHGTSLAELEKRVGDDPFVAENVVSAEIIEIAPGAVDERLGFLL